MEESTEKKYKLYGIYNGQKELIEDDIIGEFEAKYLYNEYKLAYGPEWSLILTEANSDGN